MLKSPIKNLNVFCKHYGYITNDTSFFFNKSIINISILKSELSKKPNDIYFLYQLSISYWLVKDYINSLNYIKQAYNLLSHMKNKSQYLYIYQTLCILYYNLNDYKNLEYYSQKALEVDQNLMDIYYFLGFAQKQLKK